MNGGSYTDPSQHVFWLSSRAAGIVAMVLVSGAVTLGLLLSGRFASRPGAAARVKTLHEAVTLTALGAIVLHGVLLLGDSYLRPGLAGIALPFALPLAAHLDRPRDHRRVDEPRPGPELLRPAVDRRCRLAADASLDPARLRPGARPHNWIWNRRQVGLVHRPARGDDRAAARRRSSAPNRSRRPQRRCPTSRRCRPAPGGRCARSRARRDGLTAAAPHARASRPRRR